MSFVDDIDKNLPTSPLYYTNRAKEQLFGEDAQEVDEQAAAQRLANRMVGRSEGIAVMADLIAAEGFTGSDGELILAASEAVDRAINDGIDIVGDMQGATKDEIVEAWRQQEEDEGTVVPWLNETLLEKPAAMLEAWDKAIHQGVLLGLGAIEGAVNTLSDAADGTIDESAYGYFKAAFEEAWDDEYVSEFFGIDPGSNWGRFMNIGASVAADPVTWFTAGGASSWKWTESLLLKPEMAEVFLKQPQVVSATKHLVTKTDSRVVWSLFGDGMSEIDTLRLLEIAGTSFGDDVTIKAAADEVTAIFRRNLPSSPGGQWTPSGPRSLTHVKNVAGIGEAFRNVPLMSQANKDMMAGLLARASKDRWAPLGDDFLENALSSAMWRYGNDPVKVKEAFETAVEAARVTNQPQTRLIATTTQKIQDLTQQIRAAKFALADDAGRVPGYRNVIDDLETAIAAGDDEAVAKLQTMADDARDYVDKYGSVYDEATERIDDLRSQLADARSDLDAIRSPLDRQPVEEWWVRFWNDWGLSLERMPETGRNHRVAEDGEETFRLLRHRRTRLGTRHRPCRPTQLRRTEHRSRRRMGRSGRRRSRRSGTPRKDRSK